MKHVLIIFAAASLALTTIGCAGNKTTIERHYSEDTQTTETQVGGEDVNRPQEGDHRPGNVDVEEHRSEPEIIVE